MNEDGSTGVVENIELDDFKLMILLREVFTDVVENNIIELFELLDYKAKCKIGLKEIFLIIAFSAALESNQALEYLYMYGNVIFYIISCQTD